MKKGLLKKLFATTLVGAMAISMVACGGVDLQRIAEKSRRRCGAMPPGIISIVVK